MKGIIFKTDLVRNEKPTIFFDEESRSNFVEGKGWVLKNTKDFIVVDIDIDINKCKIESTYFPGSLSIVSPTVAVFEKPLIINNKEITAAKIDYSYYPFSKSNEKLVASVSLRVKEYKNKADGKKVPYHPLPWK